MGAGVGFIELQTRHQGVGGGADILHLILGFILGADGDGSENTLLDAVDLAGFIQLSLGIDKIAVGDVNLADDGHLYRLPFHLPQLGFIPGLANDRPAFEKIKQIPCGLHAHGLPGGMFDERGAVVIAGDGKLDARQQAGNGLLGFVGTDAGVVYGLTNLRPLGQGHALHLRQGKSNIGYPQIHLFRDLQLEGRPWRHVEQPRQIDAGHIQFLLQNIELSQHLHQRALIL